MKISRNRQKEAQYWKNAASAALEQGQGVTEFVAHCHPDNRIKARKGYRAMQRQKGVSK